MKDLVRSANKVEQCSYCTSIQPSFTLPDLAECVRTAFREHYYVTNNEPDALQWIVIKDRESSIEWEREGKSVVYIIQKEAGVDEQIACDIQDYLDDSSYDDPDEAAFGSEIRYAEIRQHDSPLHSYWRDLEHELKTMTRFFSQNSLNVLNAVFADLSTMASKDGKPVLKKCGPGTDLSELYRARAFQTDERLQKALEEPARLLGSPSSNAATAGRMNAQGVSVFYGATSPKVAVAEVRFPVGSRVAIARFNIQKEVTLLDLTALQFVKVEGSIFDPMHLPRIQQTVFLKTFCKMITTPVMPDLQAFDYLITQATADYLANVYQPPLDGIIFPSTQVADDGINVVLFHKSARATGSSNSKYEVQLYSWDEDGEHPDYRIDDQTPPPMPSIRQIGRDYDWREQVLLLDDKSIIIAHVTGVTFSTEAHHVRCTRKDK